MKMKFCYQTVTWNRNRNEIAFVGCYLSGGRGRRYQVEGTKRQILPGQKLYLCKIMTDHSKNAEETFKFLVIAEEDLAHYDEGSRQYVGSNQHGNFMIDVAFMDGMKKMTAMEPIEKIKLTDLANERKADS